MERPLKDKRPFGPLVNFSQSSRPFKAEDGEEIVFTTIFSVSSQYTDKYTEDPLAASEHLKVFLELMKEQQPQLNIPASEIFVHTGNDDVVDRYDVHMPMRQPVLIFTHVEDAIRNMHREVNDEIIASDHSILPRSELRTQQDNAMSMGWVRTTFGAETIL